MLFLSLSCVTVLRNESVKRPAAKKPAFVGFALCVFGLICPKKERKRGEGAGRIHVGESDDAVLRSSGR